MLFMVAISFCIGQSPGDLIPQYELERDAKRIIRQDAKKNVLWTRLFKEDVDGVRPPHLLWDKKRVYFTHDDGVTALDGDNGKTLWHAKGPIHGLLLREGILFGTGYTVDKNKESRSCWLFACDSATGNEKFKALLPTEFSDPEAVREVAGLYLVQVGEPPSGKGNGLLFDSKGNIRHRFNRQVVNAKQLNDGIVVLTSAEVVRLSANDKRAWSVSFENHEWIAGGGLVDLPDGDFIAFRYGQICDSGVDLVCLSVSGKVKWKVHCPGLRVDHSKYCHEAFVRVEGSKLRVTSEGSSGTFVEVLDLKTGRRLERTRKGR